MFNKKVFTLLVLSSLVLAACFGPLLPPQQQQPNQNPDTVQPQDNSAPQTAAESSSVTEEHSQATEEAQAHDDAPHTSDVDLTHLQLGDGKYSTSPQVGYVYTCQTNFNFDGANAGGRGADGNWLNGDGTWNATMKAVVDGSVSWPSNFTVSIQGNERVFTGNALPDHTTGNYPISSSDDAYTYDRNPNSISAQSLNVAFPANPTAANQPTCVGGEVGIMLSGVVLFSAFDAEGNDAPAHEVQDNCDGHPQVQGVYHYHNLSDCLEDTTTGHSALMGYAFDGYGIYGYYGEDGTEVTNEDLDACHGHTHAIEWDGQVVEMYHYHATHEFPYVVGCFHGTPAVRAAFQGGGGQGEQGQPQGQQPTAQGTGQQPPQEAIDACIGLTQNASCSVGNMTGTCMLPPNSSQLACVPAGGPPP